MADILQAEDVLVTKHGVCLACACWPIGEDSCIATIEYGLDEWPNSFFIDLSKGRPTYYDV